MCHLITHEMIFLGTKTKLLEPRFRDKDPDGLDGMTIFSAHNWGESPTGNWKIRISIYVSINLSSE